MKSHRFVSFLLCICIITLLTACSTSALQKDDPLMDVKTSFGVGNYDLAAQQLLPLANEGNSEAQYALGYLFYYGLGVEQDTSLARSWFRRAASLQNRKAVEALSLIDQRESVFPPISPEAVEPIDLRTTDDDPPQEVSVESQSGFDPRTPPDPELKVIIDTP